MTPTPSTGNSACATCRTCMEWWIVVDCIWGSSPARTSSKALTCAYSILQNVQSKPSTKAMSNGILYTSITLWHTWHPRQPSWTPELFPPTVEKQWLAICHHWRTVVAMGPLHIWYLRKCCEGFDLAFIWSTFMDLMWPLIQAVRTRTRTRYMCPEKRLKSCKRVCPVLQKGWKTSCQSQKKILQSFPEPTCSASVASVCSNMAHASLHVVPTNQKLLCSHKPITLIETELIETEFYFNKPYWNIPIMLLKPIISISF